jgi:hypothetical protein
MRTTVLPFTVAATKEMLTANAGLALFCEFKQILDCIAGWSRRCPCLAIGAAMQFLGI